MACIKIETFAWDGANAPEVTEFAAEINVAVRTVRAETSTRDALIELTGDRHDIAQVVAYILEEI